MLPPNHPNDTDNIGCCDHCKWLGGGAGWCRVNLIRKCS